MQKPWPLVLVALLLGCETTEVVGLDEACDSSDWSLVKRECASGLYCNPYGVCVALVPPSSSSGSGSGELPEPPPRDAGRRETSVPSAMTSEPDAGQDSSSPDATAVCTKANPCAPGAVETTTAGCPAGQYRTRECRADCTWTNFSSTCS